MCKCPHKAHPSHACFKFCMCECKKVAKDVGKVECTGCGNWHTDSELDNQGLCEYCRP